MEKHKKHYKECTKDARKGKSCKNCKTAIKRSEKYHNCPICDFDLCMKCFKQVRIGSISPFSSLKRMKVDDFAPGVNEIREQ